MYMYKYLPYTPKSSYSPFPELTLTYHKKSYVKKSGLPCSGTSSLQTIWCNCRKNIKCWCNKIPLSIALLTELLEERSW